MKNGFNQVYQFKITLMGVKPQIWRRIQVPEDYTFWDLHVAIQDAMGWEDCHLHEFKTLHPKGKKVISIGIPEDEFDEEFLAGWKQKIADYFTQDNKRALYTYDFGDNWEHAVELEKILPREKGVKYPICVSGERACPPEDCGGPYGYEELLEIIKDPTHEEYEEKIEWLGSEFDSEHFDIKEVRFSNPKTRLKRLLESMEE